MSDKILNPVIPHHNAQAEGRQLEHDAQARNWQDKHFGIGINPRGGSVPKTQRIVPVHGGMVASTKTGFSTVGGDHASALDAMSGASVVSGAVKATPGFGNDGLHPDGGPFAKAPASKKLTPPAPSFGMRSRTTANIGSSLHELGAAVLAEAFEAGDNADRSAHGRGSDGNKLPGTVEEN
ncbi:MAG TPA: hypothetical protein VMV59_06980 [Candidatus Dormibacteraeota bacterium]|nr:hypothetical protein [Candidatus Dormibacteraeota bacterium]